MSEDRGFHRHATRGEPRRAQVLLLCPAKSEVQDKGWCVPPLRTVAGPRTDVQPQAFGSARRGETRKTTEDEDNIMETLTFTDRHVTVPSSKPYEQVIRTLESVLGEGNSRSFAEMVGATGTWDEFVREIEQRVGESGFVIVTQIDHGAWMSRIPHDMKGKLYV